MSLSEGSPPVLDDKSTPEVEKGHKLENDPTELVDDHGAHVLDVSKIETHGQSLQTARDGKTVLIPQPSSDPNDPLNWGRLKKHVILFVIAVVAFMPDFGSAMGVITLLPQTVQWKKDPNTILHANVGNVFCLGAGGLFAVLLSAYFGRLPILFYFTSVSVGTSAWCAAATSFESFMAARILNGFFSSVSQAASIIEILMMGGLMYIQDIFFFHEHPRAINIWTGAIITSPYLSPLITAFIINTKTWPDAFWVNTGVSALAWLLTVGLMDETIYNRNLPRDQQPVPRSRLLRIVGVEQWRSRHLRQTFFQALARPVISISKLPVLLSTIYYFLIYAWIIGVTAVISVWLQTIYKFDAYNLGFFFFAPIIGTVLGAIIGHWLHDFVGAYHVRRHSGIIKPEARLIIIWLAAPIMAVSILIQGYALQNTYHYMVLAVFYAGQVMGIVIATVAVNAYLLDAYPEGSGEVGAWIVVARMMGGFMSTYIELNWVGKSGLVNTFGAQTGIVAGASIIILVLGVFGKRIRKAQGRMQFTMDSGY